MQTRDQVLGKVAEMVSDLVTGIVDEAERLLNCGALDLESAQDNYCMPKVVLVVALENMANQYGPPRWDKRAKQDLKNLRRF